MVDRIKVAFDVETTGLDLYIGDRMFTYAWGLVDPTGQPIIYVNREGSDNYLPELQRLFTQSDVLLIGHNILFDLTAVEQMLGKLPGKPRIFDTMVASHILMNDAPGHGLDDCAYRICKYSKDLDKTMERYLNIGYDKAPPDLLRQYQITDIERTLLLYEAYREPIKKFQTEFDNEMDLIWTTKNIMREGVMIRPQVVSDMVQSLYADCKLILAELEQAAGRYVNPNSTRDLPSLLFNELKLPITKRTETGLPSTKKSVLIEIFNDPDLPPKVKKILDLVFKYKSYRHAAPIIASYLKFADKNNKIHTSIKPNQATTNRESSSRPNLQNVSKERVLLNPYPIPARKCFRPEPGFINMHIDYMGQELRLLVHYSEDDEFIRIIREGGDPHGAAAEVYYGAAFTEAAPTHKKTMRSAAKNADFAIPYGASALQTARTLGLPQDEGREAFNRFKKRFPKYCNLQYKYAKQVRQQGYITTAFGRRLYIRPDLAYTGVNALIQGTGAGMVKRAQNWVKPYLEQHLPGEAAIILPIHDELVLKYSRARLPELDRHLRALQKIMTNFSQFTVPMDIEVKLSINNWNDVKEYEQWRQKTE